MAEKFEKHGVRAERIREEILKAKQVAGIQPPGLIPRGEAFRAETISRPDGAISKELGLPSLRGEINFDSLESYGEPQDVALLKMLKKNINLDSDLILAKAERAIERLTGSNAPRLASVLSAQINMAASISPKDKRVLALCKKLDDVQYGNIDFSKADKDQPGGAQKRDN